MRVVAQTDKGKVRPNNEDRVAIITNPTNQQLFVVADGMGGHRAGQIASELAISYLTTQFEKLMIRMDEDQAQRWLRQTIQRVNDNVLQAGAVNETLNGMGATIVCAIDIDEKTLVVAHVGDSRAYLVNHQTMTQLTEDHSLVAMLMKKGELTIDEAKIHPRRNVVLRSLGMDGFVEVDCQLVYKRVDERVLLCSDGLTNKVSDDDIRAIVMSEASLSQKAATLIQQANDNGGNDNISVIIAEAGMSETDGGDD